MAAAIFRRRVSVSLDSSQAMFVRCARIVRTGRSASRSTSSTIARLAGRMMPLLHSLGDQRVDLLVRDLRARSRADAE
jgi:hypothetical protein